MANPVSIGVVGVGYWGKNYVRLTGQHAKTNLVGMCDMHPPTLAKAVERFPDVPAFSSVDELLAVPELEAVVIVVPARTLSIYTSVPLRSAPTRSLGFGRLTRV